MSHQSDWIYYKQPIKFLVANEAAVELANHRAVREYTRKLSSQRKGPFFDYIWV